MLITAPKKYMKYLEINLPKKCKQFFKKNINYLKLRPKQIHRKMITRLIYELSIIQTKFQDDF